MTIQETLERVQFVVGADGKPTAALLDIATWQAVVALLEDAEDNVVIRDYLARRRKADSPEAMGLIPWEQAEAKLDAAEEAPFCL
jgi:hypothetical protein